MKFLVDAQLPPVLAEWMRELGHSAEHVADIGLLSAADNEIWAAALSREAILVTKDHDFVEWAISREPAPQVLWLRIGNVGNRLLIARLKAAWGQITQGFATGARVVEAGRL